METERVINTEGDLRPGRGTESAMCAENSPHFGAAVSPAESGFLLPLDEAGPLQSPPLRQQTWERSHVGQAATTSSRSPRVAQKNHPAGLSHTT